MRTTIAVTLIAIAAAIYLAPQPKTAWIDPCVFGRTLNPNCVHVVINKRISLSGEGTFVRPQ